MRMDVLSFTAFLLIDSSAPVQDRIEDASAPSGRSSGHFSGELLGRELKQLLLLHANRLNAGYLDALAKILRSTGRAGVDYGNSLASESRDRKLTQKIYWLILPDGLCSNLKYGFR